MTYALDSFIGYLGNTNACCPYVYLYSLLTLLAGLADVQAWGIMCIK